MSEHNTKDNNQVYAKWQTFSYPHYDRGVLWYVITGLVAGAILLIAFWTFNFLLAVVVLMVGVVMVIQGGVRPPIIEIEVGPLGIRRGARFYAYKSIDHFWIVYDPPIKSLHFIAPIRFSPPSIFRSTAKTPSNLETS
jgi:hypothetical protein